MRRAGPRGLTLVELLVGLALGLFVVALAAGVLMHRVGAQHALFAEASLMQDLHASCALLARELRRAGHWGGAVAMPWQAGSAPAANPHAALQPVSGSVDALAFSFEGDSGDVVLAFRLHHATIEMRLGASGWQALTDPATMQVLVFDITPQVDEVALEALCTRPCPPGLAGCPPTQLRRSVAITLTARSPTDPRLVRSARERVQLRNDIVTGRCAP